MRSRLLTALLALSIFAPDLVAQRRTIPRTTTQRPRPAEKPPLAPGLTDPRAYSQYRLGRFSLEQYPTISHLQTTGFIAEGIPSDNWTFGDGTHLGFRVAPSLALTTDMTSSFMGGPFSLGTAEFGLRVTPWTAPRFKPFADARMAWTYTTSNGNVGSTAVPVVFLARSMYGDFTTGRGHGAMVGLGVETALTTRLSLTTEVLATRYDMRANSISSRSAWDYTANVKRIAVGLRYNHGRWSDGPR